MGGSSQAECGHRLARSREPVVRRQCAGSAPERSDLPGSRRGSEPESPGACAACASAPPPPV